MYSQSEELKQKLELKSNFVRNIRSFHKYFRLLFLIPWISKSPYPKCEMMLQGEALCQTAIVVRSHLLHILISSSNLAVR